MKIDGEVTIGDTAMTVSGFLRLGVGPNQSAIVWDEAMSMMAVLRGMGPDVVFVGMVGPIAPCEDLTAGVRMFDPPDAMTLRGRFDIRRGRGKAMLDGKKVWWLGDVTVVERQPDEVPALWSPGPTQNQLTILVGELPGGTPSGDTHYLAWLSWDNEGGYNHVGWWGRMLPPDTIVKGI